MLYCLSMYSEIQLTIKENTQQARQAIPISFDPDIPFRVINHLMDCISIFLNYFFSMHACMLSCFSCVQLFAPSQICSSPGLSVDGDSPGKNTGVGCHALLQGIFPTQRQNPGLMFPALAGRFFTTSITIYNKRMIFSKNFFFFCHAMWLAKTQFPSQELNLGHSSGSSESQATRVCLSKKF